MPLSESNMLQSWGNFHDLGVFDGDGGSVLTQDSQTHPSGLKGGLEK